MPRSPLSHCCHSSQPWMLELRADCLCCSALLGYSRALLSIHLWSAGECSHFSSIRAPQLNAELPSFQHRGSARSWRSQNSPWGVLGQGSVQRGTAPSFPRELPGSPASRHPRAALMIDGKRRGASCSQPAFICSRRTGFV